MEEKNNKCCCTAAVWCPDDNQMEPPHMCQVCQLDWHKTTSYISEQEYMSYSSMMNRSMYVNDDKDSDDDLPF